MRTSVSRGPGRRLNEAQLGYALEVIAGAANTLDSLLVLLQTQEFSDGFAERAVIDATEIIARSIGAMADGAADAQVLGDAETWLFGSHLAKLSREGQQ